MKVFAPLRMSGLGRNANGNVAITVALAAPLIALLVSGMLEYGSASSASSTLQDSLDAAVLAVARSDADTQAEYQNIGMRALEANLRFRPGASLDPAGTTFMPADDGRKVVATASAKLSSSILGGVSSQVLDIGAKSEALRPADLEVALVLDVTGSMAQGTKLADLKVAAKDLIDIVVQDQQEPFYSKVALVPYSMAVNVGALAASVRGPIAPSVPITQVSNGSSMVVTAPNHGFTNGQFIYINNIQGLQRSTDTVQHINNQAYQITSVTTNSFVLGGVDGRKYGPYSSGGTASCTHAGCQWYRFQDAKDGTNRVYEVSTCVTERTGANAYTDTQPSLALLGRNYPSAGCLNSTIQPLSSDRASLKGKIDALQAVGSTGGHIGVGWGWYMLSPKFGYLFPTAGRPAAYEKNNLIKAVVIMTDGEYNSAYCNGVISRDSTTGSGGPETHINCNAPNGHSFTQATAQCAAMKNAGVKVYTVGFNVVNDQRARDLVNNCASSPKHVHLPTTGADLKSAFRLIGQELAALRIAR